MANRRNQSSNDDYELLPSDILEHILTFLPIKDAIASSIMSHRYERSWCHNRIIDFGVTFPLEMSQSDLASIIEHVFNSHEGNEIKTFALFINPIGIELLLMKWLEICAQKNVEVLELRFKQLGYTIDFNLLNQFHKLKTLDIFSCDIKVPNPPSGLQLLKLLSLCDIRINEETFEILIKHCNILENINLHHCYTIERIKIFARENKYLKKLKIGHCEDLGEIIIDSPTLRTFFYHGYFPRFRFAGYMKLYEAFFYFTPPKIYLDFTRVEALVNRVLNVSILTTTPLLIEGMAARVRNRILRDANYCFVNLKELQVLMDGGLFCNPFDIFMFIKNCPSLERLFIDLEEYNFECGMYWEIHQKHLIEKCTHKFSQLKVVVVKNFKFLPYEVELVKMIWERAPVLEKLVLVSPKVGARSKFKIEDAPKYDKLFSSCRASLRATVIVFESGDYDGKMCVNPTHSKPWRTSHI